MAELATVIEEGIRYPGFAFVNVQSPCVTYGEEEAQLKAQKERMQRLDTLGHDPHDRLRAMALAAEYGTKLYTGVFYRKPEPDQTYEDAVLSLRSQLSKNARPKADILDMFRPR